MIAVQGIGKFLGKKDLLKDVSFQVNPGEKIGLIGSNGAGKTTLFNILLGETEPDAGTIAKTRNLRLGYLPQQWTPVEGKTILAHAMDIDREVQDIRAELNAIQKDLAGETDAARSQEIATRQTQLLERLEQLGGYDLEARASKILSGLGFRNDMLIRQASTLSGGWTMRLELARLLLSAPDLLLLDEPTNHLDLESLLWLEQYLISASSAMLLISHDRAFLNRTVKRILELEQGQLQEYAGNYDAYLEEKAKRQEIKLASYRNQQDRLRQLERFVERNRVRKSGARQAQSRLKLLDKIERIEAPTEQAEVSFSFPEPARCGKRVLELRGVSKSYADNLIYEDVDLVIERGDKIAFLGPNGAGKSTLLKMLAGTEAPSGGERLSGHNVVTGYYAQYQWEQLRPELTVLEEAFSVSLDMPQSQLRALLGAFLFRGDDVLKKVSVLSGGEKARLILCKLLLDRPNVLLLDEPTNHLDIPSRNVLESAMESYSGTICFISHDRHFINTVAKKILVVHHGKVDLFPGDYSDYQTIWKKRMEEEERPSSHASTARERGDETASARGREEQKRLEAELRNELHKIKKPIVDRLRTVEAALDQAHERLESLNARLADPATYQDGTSIKELQLEHQLCRQSIKELSSSWENEALLLEEVEEGFRMKKMQEG